MNLSKIKKRYGILEEIEFERGYVDIENRKIYLWREFKQEDSEHLIYTFGLGMFRKNADRKLRESSKEAEENSNGEIGWSPIRAVIYKPGRYKKKKIHFYLDKVKFPTFEQRMSALEEANRLHIALFGETEEDKTWLERRKQETIELYTKRGEI